MASEVSTNHVDVLERILLDESAKPMKLPLSLLKDITNCFSSDHEIGRGGFAVVYKGVVGKGMVALKKLSNTYGIHESKFQEEVICLIQVKHKNIVRFLGYCAYQQGEIEECDGSLVMVDQRNMLLCFECACNGSLDKHITGASDGLNWRQRYQIILGICEGLRFLHEKRIVHLDLKPANILLDGQMVPKIVDFGQSRILSQVQTRAITQNIYGTRGYMSLEYIISGQITFASDIFSLGVIIIEIMKGERQHVEDEHVVESWRIRLQALEGDMQLEQVRVCYKIAIECMDLDPKKRPVAQHIVNRLDKMASVVYSGKSSIGTSQVNVLERLLFDESVEPTNLPLSLLQDITNHFSLDHQIGSGTFAVVYKGMAGKGTVAVKKLSNTFGLHENKFQEEIKCLIKAKHKNIVRFLGYCADTQGKMKEYEGNLVMEEERIWVLCFDYVCNGSLEKHITDATCGLNWRKRYQIIRGISEGLAFLHDKRILHLDLKPANILLDGHMVPKIADFGLSRCLIQAQNYAITQDISGTLGYMDPEYLRSGKVGFSSDVYSLGVIIMEILTGARRYHKDELVSLPREQSGGRVGKPAAESLQVDIKEHSEILEDVESIECLHSQENQEKLGQLSLWGGQDIMEKVNRHGTSNSTSISTGFCELSILSIYNRTAYWIFERNKEQSHFINIFRMEELRPIIMSNLIREVNSAKVYKGVVENALVAVKQRFNVDEKQLENEFIVQSQIIHKNIACFIGCCLEMDTPILVYEFLPRGTLDDILHRGSKVPLNLDVRLNIVAESAQGLAYMHSQARTKIPHGNVKPANILLDHNFMPKIAIFGLSWVMARDKEDASIVIGDMTYMDPVYMQTGLLTEKCDVYSFGVVILELISRKPTYINGVWLVQSFIEFQREGKKATELLDKDIAVTTRDLEILDCLAEIAVDCVNPDMDQRPTMTEVAEHLLVLNRSCRLHERHINTEYSEETDIGGSFVEQRKVAHLTRAVQDTNHHVRGNYSSVSTRFFKLNNLDITNWKERRNFNRKTRHTLEMSHFIKIFRKGELKPIIRSSNIIGKGPIAEVYKGLVDYTPVVVKIPINGIFQKDARFENQVIIMSQVIHRNIVRLIGCCLNVDTPMLVYEFVSQGSLDDILHRSNGMSLNLDVRLTILAESAQGLAYLHSQARVKIWHGSVKPGNILLDENFMPKISGFGLSKLIPGDEELTENIIGDWSYVDPVYMQTGLLTLKSDVYSFGVVILELISGKKPTHSDNHSLVRSFLEVHKEGKKATELFDKEIAVTAGDFEILDRLAEIAVECINLEVDRRPTMTNVAERLLMLNRSRRSQDLNGGCSPLPTPGRPGEAEMLCLRAWNSEAPVSWCGASCI